MPKSRITVFITTYNQARFLPQAIDSVLSQTRLPDEFFVIDDCSEDNVVSEMKKYKDNVEFIRHKRNIGNIATYNEGIRRSKEDYILHFAGDDWLAPDIVKKETDILDKNPKVGLVYAQTYSVANGKQVLIYPKPAGKTSYIGRKNDLELLLTQGDFVPATTAMVRKSVYKRLGLWDKNFPYSADYEMWIRVAKNYSLAYIAEPLAYYRTHGKNMHLNSDYEDRIAIEHLNILKKHLSKKSKIKENIIKTAYFNYFISQVNRHGFSKDYKAATIFLMKAVSIKPSALTSYLPWQSVYLLLKSVFI